MISQILDAVVLVRLSFQAFWKKLLKNDYEKIHPRDIDLGNYQYETHRFD